MARLALRASQRNIGIVVSSIALAITASASAQVSSLNLDFNGGATGIGSTGFDAAYNPDSTGYSVNFSGNGKLSIATLPGDTFGDYEGDPDSAKNFFYTNFAVGDRAVLTARVNAVNLNNNFHGGGIWMGTDEDHYIRLGIVNNTFEGGVTIESLRENEDRWKGPGDIYLNRPGFDIESRNIGVNDFATPTPNGTSSTKDLTAILKLVRDHHAVAAYYSLDNGATWLRTGGAGYSFNALSTDATTLPVDNRTAANPNNPDKTSPSVEGGFKVGAYALGGGSSPAVIQFDSLNAISGTPTYTGAASGDYVADANWSNNNGIGAPTNIESTALLPSSASARTLTVNSDITATNMTFASAAGTTISGTGVVRFDWFYFPTHADYYTDGPGKVTVSAGTHTISAPSTVAHLHTFDIASGATLALTNMTASPVDNPDAGVRKIGLGTMNVNRLLTANANVEAGTLKILAGGTAASLSTLNAITVTTTAGSTAKLDITNNAVVVDYAVAPAVSPLATLTAQIKSARATGNWSGPGITSSNAAADTTKGIGIVESSAITGKIPTLFGTPDTTAVLLRYTYLGDTNIDGTVNFDDLINLAQNYNGTGKTWFNGDSDYNGTVNFDDLIPLAQNYNKSNPTLTAGQLSSFGGDFASDWALAASLVPEPTTLAAVSLLGTTVIRRRRRL